MPAITIDKLKIKDGLPTINFTAVDAKGKKYSVPGAEYTDPVHIDLQKALDKLNVHLALSTSMLPMPGDLSDINEELLTYYHMHGVSIKEDGVTLSGHKILPNKKAFNFNSPFIRFAESEETQYTFIEDLIEDIERVQKEVNLYLDGSKRAEDPQLDLFSQPKEPPVTKITVAEPAKKDGVFTVETAAGVKELVIDELPILPENGTIADVNDKALYKPKFKPEKVPNSSFVEQAAAKGAKPKGTATGRKRVPQSAANPSGIPE